MKEQWEDVFVKAMTQIARRKGLGRRAAGRAAVAVISEMRKIREMRMKPLS